MLNVGKSHDASSSWLAGRWLRGCVVAIAVGVVGLSSAQAAEWRKAAASERQVAAVETPDWAYLVAGKIGTADKLNDLDLADRSARGISTKPDDGNVQLTDISSIVLWDELTRRGGSGGAGNSVSGGVISIGVVKAQ